MNIRNNTNRVFINIPNCILLLNMLLIHFIDITKYTSTVHSKNITNSVRDEIGKYNAILLYLPCY